jgi:site-specific recombinase XerD
MPRKKAPEKIKGVYERQPGSGVWWIQYFVEGKRHRERVGSRGNAVKLYQTRKADALARRKLPQLRTGKKVCIADLTALVIEYTANHRSARDYISRASIVNDAMGTRPAEEVKPAEIEAFLRQHCKTDATANRYKAFLSLCYQEGIRNGKVEVNPARLVRQRREQNSRLEFLTRPQYTKLKEVIKNRFPQHLAEFIVSVNTGMRLTEQYTLEWSQYNVARRVIRLDTSKNGDGREIPLTREAIQALKSIQSRRSKPSSPIFPRDQYANKKSQRRSFSNLVWFIPCLKEAGIGNYTWHNNRHTFCSWLAMNGATIKEIQELAGHRTIQMSARYAHLTPDHKQAVISALDAANE